MSYDDWVDKGNMEYRCGKCRSGEIRFECIVCG